MMHHRCSPSSHMGACSCGLFHNQTAGSFSMIFSHKSLDDAATAAGDVYSFPAAATSSVDCTLSLGTPSTRLSDDDDRRRRSYVPNFCWDLLHCQTPPPLQAAKTTRPPANVPTGGGDPLLARRCANCDTTSTPLWRNGPRGPKSLCNACGIRFKKEERRANACNGGGTAGSGLMEHQAYNSWVQSQKMQCFSPTTEFRFIEDNDADAGIPFLSWRLNVTDRPASLVHDFTR